MYFESVVRHIEPFSNKNLNISKTLTGILANIFDCLPFALLQCSFTIILTPSQLNWLPFKCSIERHQRKCHALIFVLFDNTVIFDYEIP